MTLTVNIENSWRIDLLRHIQHPHDSKIYYNAIVLARVFSQAKPTQLNGPLEIHFRDNHFSNVDSLNYIELHKSLSKFFNPVTFLSDNPYDILLAPDYFKFKDDIELASASEKFNVELIEANQPLMWHDNMKMFGLHIKRPDVHRLGMMIQFNRNGLFNHTDCRLGFSSAPLMADEYWRSSGIDLCCKMMQESHLDVLQLIDSLPKSDRSFLTKGADIQSGRAEQYDREKNILNKNFVVEIICQSSFANNVFNTTEKINRCLAMGQPFIILGNKHIYKHLRTMGVKTFNSIWNETWDDLDATELHTKITKIGAVCNELATKYSAKELFLATQKIRDHNYNYTKEHSRMHCIKEIFNLS
jgi:hypothetical protein